MNAYLLIGRITGNSYLVRAFTSDRAIAILEEKKGESASCWFIAGFSPLSPHVISVN